MPAVAPRRSGRVTSNQLGSYTTPQRPSGAGSSFLALLRRPDRRPAIVRKECNLLAAAARNRAFRATHPSPPGASNVATLIQPKPIASIRSEMPLSRALQTLPADLVTNALSKELTKQFVTYCALRTIDPRDIEPTAVLVPSMLLFKQKLDGSISCRMPVNGARQPASTYDSTYAGTSDPTNRMFLLATTMAHVALHRKTFTCGKFDIPATFLQELLPRSATGGHQLITRLSKTLPDVKLLDGSPAPRANSWAELLRPVYGLKQSNHIFDYGLGNLLMSNAWMPTPSDPYTFRKVCPHDPTDFLAINLHVDDGSYMGCSASLRNELQQLLLTRYGPDLVFQLGDCGICGVESSTSTDGSVSLHMTKYIVDFLHTAGMDLVPGALTPSVTAGGGLFAPSTGMKLSPQETTQFQSNNGAMIYMLPIRFDINMELRHLCTKNQQPTASDRTKQIHLMRYLKTFPSLGPVYSSNPVDYADGVTISGQSDSAHGNHSENGQSHSAFLLSIGTRNAPFCVYSRAEPGVALSPHESEYSCGSRCGRTILFFRQFATDLGYPQLTPTKLHMDSQTAINLTTAPAISRLSRHIAQHHHFLRWLYQTRVIMPVHIGTHDITANGMTKTLGPSEFIYFRHHLFHPFQL